jgi:hypothetical protein
MSKENKIDYTFIAVMSFVGILLLTEYLENDYPILKNRGQFIGGLLIIPIGVLGGLAVGRTHAFIRALLPAIFSDIFTIGVIAAILSYVNLDDNWSIYYVTCSLLSFLYGYGLRGLAFSTPFFSKLLGTEETQFIGEDSKEEKMTKWYLVLFVIVLVVLGKIIDYIF